MVQRRFGEGDDSEDLGDPADEPDVIEELRQAVAMFDAATPFERGPGWGVRMGSANDDANPER